MKVERIDLKEEIIMFKPNPEFRVYVAREKFGKAFKRFTDNFFGEDKPEFTVPVSNIEELFMDIEYAANELLLISPDRKKFIINCYSELIPYLEELKRHGIHLSSKLFI